VIITDLGFSAMTFRRCCLRTTLVDRWCLGFDAPAVLCTVCVVARGVDGGVYALTGVTCVLDPEDRGAAGFFVVVA
jgi:hypothetical protein